VRFSGIIPGARRGFGAGGSVPDAAGRAERTGSDARHRSRLMAYGCTLVARQRPVHITLLTLANGSQRFHCVFLKVRRIAMRLQRRRIAVLLVDEEAARVIDMPMDHVHQASRLLARRSLKFFED